jgi:pimeloyl-ACP methyl ester carboxylesterase
MSALMASTTDSALKEPAYPSAQAWFYGGEHLGYDPSARTVVSGPGAPRRVFLRREGNVDHTVTFLPGFPDGSFGWAKVRAHLPNANAMSKLFVEYLGMGDSDKPQDYAYSTAERADLLEALWRHLGVKSTTLVAFDFSSLVVLEHLRRRLERAEQGQAADGPKIRGVFIFNGGLFTDGHSHPWYTTPMLRRLPGRARRRLGRSMGILKRVMWSREYEVTEAELSQVSNAINRREGGFFLGAGAGFVVEHKAQGERLDFGKLYNAYRSQFPFLVGGSEKDPFEHRQVDFALERLGKFGLRVEWLPGGHLTTYEQPEALASLIARFVRALA